MQPRKASICRVGSVLVRASSSSRGAGAALGHCASTRTASLASSGSGSPRGGLRGVQGGGRAKLGQQRQHLAALRGLAALHSLQDAAGGLVLVGAGLADGVERLEHRLALGVGLGFGGNIEQRREGVGHGDLPQRFQRGQAHRLGPAVAYCRSTFAAAVSPRSPRARSNSAFSGASRFSEVL